MDTCAERGRRAWWFISAILLVTRVEPSGCASILLFSIPLCEENAYGHLAKNCAPSSQRQFVKFGLFAHVATWEDLWDALPTSLVHNIMIVGPEVEVPADATGMVTLRPPLSITSKLSIIGNPSFDRRQIVRFNVDKRMMRIMADGVPPTHENHSVVGIRDGYPSHPLGACYSVPWQPAVNLSVLTSHGATQFPGIQQTNNFNLPQVGCSNSYGVPYQQHRWEGRTAVVHALPADGEKDAHFQGVPIRNNIFMWAQNIKVRCELMVSLTLGTRGHPAYACFLSALNSSRYGSSSQAAASAAQRQTQVPEAAASQKAHSELAHATSKTQNHNVKASLIYGVIAVVLGAVAMAGMLMAELCLRRMALQHHLPNMPAVMLPYDMTSELHTGLHDGIQCTSTRRSHASDLDQVCGTACAGDDGIMIDGNNLHDVPKFDTSDWIWVE